ERGNGIRGVGMRGGGVIGDVDGDGTPNQGACPGATVLDETGIGNNEAYVFEIHAGCSLASTITVTVNGPSPGTATADFGGGPVAIPASDWKFVGHDLEVKLTNVDLPPTWFAYFTTGAVRDGLEEDAVQSTTPIPTLALQIAKTANPTSICAGKSTVFTITVTNTGSAPGTVTLTDHP